MSARFIMRLALALTPVLAATLFSSGCVTSVADSAARRLNRQAEASDSPYRYRAYSVPGGSAVEKYRVVPPTPSPTPADLQPTTANAELQKDILAKIDVMRQGWGSHVTPSLLGVQPLGVSGDSIREAWFIKQGDGAIRYEVTMTSSSQGGTDFKVEEP
jgi:hypothetical protein